MEIISGANVAVLNILKNFKKTDNRSRMLKYCVQTPVDEGILLFNLLTRELVLLTEEEYTHITDLDYMKEHWFVVPENTNDKEYVNLIKAFLTAKHKNFDEITNYSIFTTTDCNARCFYCVEHGSSRIPMSCETAKKIVPYIKKHHGGKPIRINWFGGEPLLNTQVIDLICDELHQEGIDFRSKMISNGYLFNDSLVDIAVNKWNLKEIQITLDGTENVYNKVKAYVYPDGNPYKIVLDNIDRLLSASIAVSIRLNMDLYNAQDLMVLVDELAERFGNKPYIYVYVHQLFDDEQSSSREQSNASYAAREAALCQIEDKLYQSGLKQEKGISKQFKHNHCMADSGTSITILPKGNIGLCELQTEAEFIGHIDQEGFDQAVIASWKKTTPEIPECDDCFYYPDCYKIEKCGSSGKCYPERRSTIERRTKRQMVWEYKNAK